MEVVKKIDNSDTDEFWNLDENSGYKKIKASDGKFYKVWFGDKNENHQKKWWYNVDNHQEVAETLARVKGDILKLLNCLNKNPQLWSDHPIAFGMYHTFDLHLHKPFEYMEMRPNTWGGIGLNKPKEITVVKLELENGKKINYDLGTKRTILLTLRNQNTGELKKYSDILDLAIHELTHTTCNDTKWIPEWKGGNHRYPYPEYHRLMRRWAKECGLKINSNQNKIN
jgi:hypothetical protein